MVFGPGFNFAQVPVRKPDFDLAGPIMQGFQLGRIPQQMADQRQAQQIANALREAQTRKAGLEADYLPEEQANRKIAAALKDTQRRINEAKLMDPLLGTPVSGAVRNAISLQLMKQRGGEDNPLYKAGAEAQELERKKQTSIEANRERLARSAAFRSLPAASRQRAIATAVAMGYTDDEAARLLSDQGFTLPELAQMKGVKIKDVQPSYPTSQANITQMQQRKAVQSEIDSLEKDVANPAIEKYGRRFFGYSPQQTWDAIKGENIDDQAKFLASRALQPEIANLRIRLAQGQSGVTLINEMMSKAFGNVKAFESLVSPKVRAKMDKYINQYLSRAMAAYMQNMEQQSQLGLGARFRNQPNQDLDVTNKVTELDNLSLEELRKMQKKAMAQQKGQPNG